MFERSIYFLSFVGSSVGVAYGHLPREAHKRMETDDTKAGEGAIRKADCRKLTQMQRGAYKRLKQWPGYMCIIPRLPH
jgi:hypothetical protein